MLQMSESLEPFVGYTDGASRSTQNLFFAAWTIFDPSGELVSFQGICIVEYSALIELLFDAISLGIHRIIIRLDSQLILLQLTNIYILWNPTILCMFLRVHLLERIFEYIQYQHISISFNTLTNSLANYVLNWHLRHM